MSISVEWDDGAKTIIRTDYQGSWNWDDFRTAAAQSTAMTEEVKYKVDFIANMSESDPLPEGALVQFNEALLRAPADRGLFVIVAADSWMQTMSKILGKATQGATGKFALSTTLEEARSIIAERRQED